MADRMVKVVGKHIKDCFAVKNRRSGQWPTEWGPIAYGRYGDPIVCTERRYGKKGVRFRYWLRFICNCGGCPAELHVDSEFILQAAPRYTDGDSQR